MIIVLRESLIPGKEYYIESLTQDNDGTITINQSIEKLIGKFIKYKNEFSFFCEFRGLKEPLDMGYDVRVGTLWNFYLVQKNEIQNNMEKRALDMILREITGDPCFAT